MKFRYRFGVKLEFGFVFLSASGRLLSFLFFVQHLFQVAFPVAVQLRLILILAEHTADVIPVKKKIGDDHHPARNLEKKNGKQEKADYLPGIIHHSKVAHSFFFFF